MSAPSSVVSPWTLAVLSAVSAFLAWRFPAEPISAVLGWVTALLLCGAAWHARNEMTKPSYKALYVAGIVVNVLGFYWLFDTISRFGGFGVIPTFLIFSLFVLVSAIQYPLFLFLYRFLPSRLDSLCLRLAIAWTASEHLAIRIFPWQLSHTQLGFSPLAQIADIGGSLLVSFLMMWVSEAVIVVLRDRQRRLSAALPLLTLVVCLGYGYNRVQKFSSPSGPLQDVALVQANISLEEKGDVSYFTENTRRYRELTQKIARPGLLVVWPESVIQDWVSINTLRVENDPRLPTFSPAVNLLTGALTFQSQKILFNSGLAIYADGTIPAPYNKIILMPFGEYTPFSETFPALGRLNANVGGFTPGSAPEVFEFPSLSPEGAAQIAKVAALICYEDVIPRLARESTQLGAELLVNLTNDAWFGRGPAAEHHNLIASFRAIENRRYLLRSTNTGLTTIINPLGETVSQLSQFSEGTLLASVHLMSYKTVYTQWVGDYPWWILSIGAFAWALVKGLGRFFRRRLS